VKFGVLRFPGSCDEVDALNACSRYGDAELLWHHDRHLHDVDAIVVPGGFSYGDYLRPGAIARFSPVMESVAEFARDGGPVLGICNGFQVLCEAHMLPGALIRNRSLQFQGERVWVRVEHDETAFTHAYDRDQLLHLHGREAARVGNLSGVLAIRLEVLEIRLRRHVEDHDVAALFGLAGNLGLDSPRQRFFERAEIALLIRDVGQLLLGADVIPEHIFWRRDTGALGQVVDQRRQELGLGRRLLHKCREVRIVGDHRRGRGFARLCSCNG